MHLCIEGGHLDVAEYLAPVMKEHLYDTDDEGTTTLHKAVRKGQLSMLEYLVEKYAFDVAKRDKVGQSEILCMFI